MAVENKLDKNRKPFPEVSESTDPRMENLVKCLDLSGQKLHELKAIMYQESLYTGHEVDDLGWLMLSSRFSKQVRLVDSLRLSKTTSISSLSDIASRKEKYHIYEAELKDFSAQRNKQDLDCLFDDTNSISTSSLKTSGTTTNSNNSGNSVDVNAFNWKNLNRAGPTDRDNVSKLSFEKVPPEPAATSTPTSSHPKLSIPSLDTSGNSYQYKKEEPEPALSPVKYYKESEEMTRDPIILTPEVESKPDGLTIDIFEDRDGDEISSFKRQYQNGILNKPPPPASRPLSQSKKCKVMKVRSRVQTKTHVQDLFPVKHSPPKTTINRSDTEKSLNALGDCDDSLTNKLKSPNESWYEFKERCSSSSLPMLASPVPFGASASASESGFLLDDLRSMSSSSTSQVIKKSVRFNTGAYASPRAGRFDSNSKSSSSGDDEVSFAVQQFPCVISRRRGGGILKR